MSIIIQPQKINRYAIIVAGGTGKRMNQKIPKQFHLINNFPVLFYSIRAFKSALKNIHIIVVLPKKFHDTWKKLSLKYKLEMDYEIVHGGNSRFESVKNGLKKVGQNGFVAIHDAARPVITKSFIKKVFSFAEKYDNAVPCIPVNESLKRIENGKNKSIDRRKYMLVQTPQCFSVSMLKKAYKQKYSDLFTDDSSIVENMGVEILLIKGEQKNIKITYPSDIKYAEMLINKMAQQT